MAQRSLVMTCPCETLEGTSHGTVNLVEPLGQENRPVGSRHIWTQMSQVSKGWCHKCTTVQCHMLQEDNTNPKEAWHPFSDLVLDVEGKAVLSVSCKHDIPLAPHQLCNDWAMWEVRSHWSHDVPNCFCAVWTSPGGPWGKVLLLILFFQSTLV